MQAIVKQFKSPASLEQVLRDNKQLDVCEKDKHGDAPVHFAARKQSVPILKILYDHGADMEAMNEHARRPLHEAIDSLDCVAYLVESCKVNVNALKRGDWTPVMIAAMKGRMDIVTLLVSKGAILDLVNKDGRTALHMACQEGHEDLAEYLALQCPVAIMRATKSGRLPPQIAAALQGMPRTALQITTHLLTNAPIPMADLLLHKDKTGRNILQDAVVGNNVELVEFLFEHRADPNQADMMGRTVIHNAAMVGNMKVLQAIQTLSSGRSEADSIQWDAPDAWDHWTPLMHAAREGHLEVVQFLVEEMGANLLSKSRQNMTAKGLACLWQHQPVAEYLDGKGGSEADAGQS